MADSGEGQSVSCRGRADAAGRRKRRRRWQAEENEEEVKKVEGFYNKRMEDRLRSQSRCGKADRGTF